MYSLSTVQGFRVALNMKIMKQLHSFALTTFCGPCGLGLKSNNISRTLPLLQELWIALNFDGFVRRERCAGWQKVERQRERVIESPHNSQRTNLQKITPGRIKHQAGKCRQSEGAKARWYPSLRNNLAASSSIWFPAVFQTTSFHPYWMPSLTCPATPVRD